MNLSKQNLDTFDVSGKKLLLRCDLNVPLNDQGVIVNNNRIVESLPTIRHCIEKKATRIIIVSHLGRPNGKVNAKHSLKPVADELSKLLTGHGIHFVTKPIPELSEDDFGKGHIFLLENIRFYAAEEGSFVDDNKQKIKVEQAKIDAFRKQLSSLCDVNVNDAFGTCHRAHSSIVGIDRPRICGFLLKKELEYFAKALHNPVRPFVAILGGAKIADKILLIENLLDQVDRLIIGGGMAFTFLKVSQGMEIGSSLFDEKGATLVSKFMEKAKEKNVKIILPSDFIVSDKFPSTENESSLKISQCTAEDGIAAGLMGLDCGEKSRASFAAALSDARTVVWNGPPGVFEFDAFAGGTRALCATLAERSKKKEEGDDVATVIVGGGESATCAQRWCPDVAHISTGGGAALELLEGKPLPGVAALSDV